MGAPSSPKLTNYDNISYNKGLTEKFVTPANNQQSKINLNSFNKKVNPTGISNIQSKRKLEKDIVYQQQKNPLLSSTSSPLLIDLYSKNHHEVKSLDENDEKLSLASSSNFRAVDSNFVQVPKSGSYFDGYYEEG